MTLAKRTAQFPLSEAKPPLFKGSLAVATQRRAGATRATLEYLEGESVNFLPQIRYSERDEWSCFLMPGGNAEYVGIVALFVALGALALGSIIEGIIFLRRRRRRRRRREAAAAAAGVLGLLRSPNGHGASSSS